MNPERIAALLEPLWLPNGLALDRRTNPRLVSSAATGFVLAAAAELVLTGTWERVAVVDKLRSAVSITLSANPPENRGWLAHFTDPQGVPYPASEVSTIDTALFFLGALQAASLVEDTDTAKRLRAAVDVIDQAWLLRKQIFIHGFYWVDGEPQFIEHTWNDTSEGGLLYHLFGRPFEPEVIRVDFPLFVYCYPVCFRDVPTDRKRLSNALEFQHHHFGYVGITATDGPDGYTVGDPELIAPVLLSAIASPFPRAEETLRRFDVDRLAPAYHVPTGWTSDDLLGIDLGSAFVLHQRLRARSKE